MKDGVWLGVTYDVDDAHPDVARYKYTRTLLRDDVVIRTKTWEEPIPRDHQ
jgi:hypothetical protein